MFTRDQIEEIKKKLIMLGTKDTQFPDAHKLNGEEIVAIVQDGENKKIPLSSIINDDFINVSKDTTEILTLSTAVSKIDTNNRKLGQVITFKDSTNSWAIRQFTGSSLDNWNDISLWKSISGIDELKSQVETNAEDISVLSDEIERHDASIINLNTDVSKLKDKDIETSSSLSELTTRVDTLKSQADTNTSNISSLNTEVSTLQSKVDANTTSISQINNTISDHEESITQINTKLEEHTESINSKITTDRIEDGAVTTDKLSNGAVTSEKINSSAFDSTLSVSGKIAPADVVGGKLSELDDKTSKMSIEDTTIDDEEMVWSDDDNQHTYASIGKYGVKAKAYLDINGNPLDINADINTKIIVDGEDITSMFQSMLDYGGNIYIKGIGTAYISSPLCITKNNTHIHVDDTVTLKIADTLIESYSSGHPVWMIHTKGSLYYWEDSRVGTEKIDNISIEGGIWDFNGYHRNLMNSSLYPNRILAEFVGMSIVDATNFKMHDLTLLGASSFCTMFAGLQDFHIYNIVIHTTGGSHDGLHFHGDLNNGVIENISGETTGDDIIGLNTGGDYWGDWMKHENVVRKGHSSNIVIRNIMTESNVRLLNGSTHRLSRVLIDNVGKVSITSYGEDAYYNDITIRNIRRYSWVYYQGSSNGALSCVCGYKNIGHQIYIDKLTIEGVCVKNRPLMHLESTHIKHLVLNDIDCTFSPHPWQVNDPSDTDYYIGILKPLIDYSNIELMDSSFNGTGVNGSTEIDCMLISGFSNNDGSELVDKNNVSYTRIPFLFKADKIKKIAISSSIMYYIQLTNDDSSIIKISEASFIN